MCIPSFFALLEDPTFESSAQNPRLEEKTVKRVKKPSLKFDGLGDEAKRSIVLSLLKKLRYLDDSKEIEEIQEPLLRILFHFRDKTPKKTVLSTIQDANVRFFFLSFLSIIFPSQATFTNLLFFLPPSFAEIFKLTYEKIQVGLTTGRKVFKLYSDREPGGVVGHTNEVENPIKDHLENFQVEKSSPSAVDVGEYFTLSCVSLWLIFFLC